jgi:hypothetical protein
MITPTTEPVTLPPPDVLAAQIEALEQERQQLMQLLRMSRAAHRAAEARARREALRTGGGPNNAA